MEVLAERLSDDLGDRDALVLRPTGDSAAGVSRHAPTMRRALLWNSIVWAAAVFASAVVLKGYGFVGVLIVLLCGAVASDAVIAAAAKPGEPSTDGS